MKTINFILILVLLSTFYSCSDDDTQNDNPSQNGFTFNSEFYPTDVLFTAGNPGELTLFIVGNTSEFNPETRAFEDGQGQVVTIAVLIELDAQGNFSHTYTDAIQSSTEDITTNSFAAALIRNVSSIDPLLSGSPGSGAETLLIATSGDVSISFDSETLVITTDYTFTTNAGTITGYHESEFITPDS